MGVAFCVVFENDVPPHGKLGADCIVLAKVHEKLEEVADEHGLRTLGSYLSQDPQELADMIEMDAEEMALPPVEWFSAADGLKAVQALAAHLRGNPKGIVKSKEIVADLERVEIELTAAVRSKVKFHFAFVP